MVRVIRVLEYTAASMEELDRHLHIRGVKDAVNYGGIGIREAFIGGPFGMYETYTVKAPESDDDLPF